jgi:hypothetical protein
MLSPVFRNTSQANLHQVKANMPADPPHLASEVLQRKQIHLPQDGVRLPTEAPTPAAAKKQG